MPRYHAPLAISDTLTDSLKALDDRLLQQRLGDVLDNNRRRPLLRRRDELLKSASP